MPHAILEAIVKIALLIGGMMTAAAYFVLLERWMAAWIQDRKGPNRVGIPLTNIKMFGLGQPLADTDAAIDVWHSLFGDSFPAAPHRSVQNALTALAAGSLSTTGRPSTTQAGQQTSTPGRSWSTSRHPMTCGATVFGNPRS